MKLPDLWAGIQLGELEYRASYLLAEMSRDRNLDRDAETEDAACPNTPAFHAVM